MTRIYTTALLALAIATGASTASADDFGYCTDNLNRNNIFRLGSTERQGMCIRLTHDKLQALKGASITGVKAALGSSRTTDGNVTVFIATAPGAEALTSKTAKISGAVKWGEYTFDAPYVITGDEAELYIGYEADINTKSSLLLTDFTTDSEGCTYAYCDGSWIDTYGLGYGSASIRAVVDNAPTVTDMMIKPVEIKGYLKAGQASTLKAQLFNCGNTTVESIDVQVKVGDNSRVYSLASLSIAPNTVYDIDLQSVGSDAEGAMALSVEITEVNGGSDSAAADNIYTTDIYFYPTAMERNILLEGFTGMDCSNCPSGHSIIAGFLASGTETPVIEVMHHSGYQPDLLTMDADMDYTYFYGSPSTFAPAMMLNRTLYPAISTVPVLNVSTQILTNAYAQAEAVQPYVSLALNSAYDPATRRVDLSLSTLTHVDLPAAVNVLNVLIVQDGIVRSQAPMGDTYVHNHVFRGCATGNSWGVEIGDAASCAGGTAQWSTSFTLPEYIFSDYWASFGLTDEQKQVFSTQSLPEDMYLVAYVAAFDSANVGGHAVYNAVKTRLGESYVQGGFTGIEDAEASVMPTVRVSGRHIAVDGEYDSLAVYTLDGRSVDATAALSAGVYVVRITHNGNAVVKKLLVK